MKELQLQKQHQSEEGEEFYFSEMAKWIDENIFNAVENFIERNRKADQKFKEKIAINLRDAAHQKVDDFIFENFKREDINFDPEELKKPTYLGTLIALDSLKKQLKEDEIQRLRESSTVVSRADLIELGKFEESTEIKYEAKIILEIQQTITSEQFQSIKNGERNNALVAALQQNLVNLGYDLGNTGLLKNGVDGDYGEKTVKALRNFQFRYLEHMPIKQTKQR